MKKRSIAPLIFGLAFVAFGIIYLGNMIFDWNIDVFFNGWWTLFIIVPAFIASLTNGPKTFYFEVMIVGVSLLLWCQDIISTKYLWIFLIASALILAGISLIISFFKPKKNVVIETKQYTVNSSGNTTQSTVHIDSNGVRVSGDGIHVENIVTPVDNNNNTTNTNNGGNV